jgi:DNA topoisomerase-1
MPSLLEAKEFSQRFSESKVRHVRTPEGEDRFDQPIGSIIVKDRVLNNLTVLEPKYEGYDLVQGPDGEQYDVGHDDTENEWVATRTERWTPILVTDDTEDGVYEKLDQYVEKQKANAPSTKMRKASPEDRKRLVLPPAWTDVQVAVDDRAPLQAIGTDAKGRKQYRYSKEHTEQATAKKFARVAELAKLVEKLDKALERDVIKSDDAAALLLMRKLGMRPGSNRETGADKKAYGATTLERRHVKINQGSVRFHFDSKKGGITTITTKDPLIREMLEARMTDLGPRDKLFDTTETKTMAYMKDVAPDFKQKDLRTLVGSTVAAEIVAKMKAPKNKTEYNKMRNQVGDMVSEVLQNTRSVALNSYINPATFLAWQQAIGLEG